MTTNFQRNSSKEATYDQFQNDFNASEDLTVDLVISKVFGHLVGQMRYVLVILWKYFAPFMS